MSGVDRVGEADYVARSKQWLALVPGRSRSTTVTLANVVCRLPNVARHACANHGCCRVIRQKRGIQNLCTNRTLIGPNQSRRAHRGLRDLVHSAIAAADSRVIVGGLVLVFVACDRGDASTRKRPPARRTPDEALAATPELARQAPPYVARALDSSGRVIGTIEIDGPPPLDSVVQPSLDQTVCGVAFTRRGIERRGNRAVGVVVWIDGIRSGKGLPIERRFEIANDRCVVVPELLTAIAGGTLNVQNLDAVEHRTRITRRDGGDVLATIRETDEGQVVPNEHVLAKPGILMLDCPVHPWTHAWIAVFDHPYFATSASDGSFVIDSVPPGRYQLHAWHPRLGSVEDSITIEAGKVTTIALRARTGS
jgi:hypothetical protein